MGVKIIFLVIFGILILGSIGLSQGSSNALAQSDSTSIPGWIKNVAAFWDMGEVSDEEFSNALEFLIKEKIVQSPDIRVLDEIPPDVLEEKSSAVIPSWIKFNAKVWSQGEISNSDFIGGIKFLIKEKIISSPRIQIVDLSTDDTTGTETTTDDTTGTGTTDDTTGTGTTDDTTGTGTSTGDTNSLDSDIEDEQGLPHPPTPSVNVDSDGDGVYDDEDNCPNTNNPGQTNTDMKLFNDSSVLVTIESDDRGDVCDDDDDGDGLSDLDESDWCLLPLNPDSNGDRKTDGFQIKNQQLPYTALKAYPVKCTDGDQDGLPDNVEDKIGSLKGDPSSDGDAYEDGTEYFMISTLEKAIDDPNAIFDSSIPDLSIEIRKIKFSLGQTTEKSTASSDKITSSLTTLHDTSEIVSAGVHSEVGAEVTYGTDGFGAEISLNIDATAGYDYSESWNMSESTAKEIEKKAETNTSYTLGESTSVSFVMEIENIGKENLVNLPQIFFNVYVDGDLISSQDTQNLVSTGTGGFKDLTSGLKHPFMMENIDVTRDEALKILNGAPIQVKLSHYSYGEQTAYFEKTTKRNLQLTISSEKGTLKQFIYLKESDLTIEQVLDLAGYQDKYDIIDGDGITKFTTLKHGEMVGDYTNLPYKIFSIKYNKNSGNPDNAKVSNLKFNNGDFLKIEFYKDTDGDLLTDRDEQTLGTCFDKTHKAVSASGWIDCKKVKDPRDSDGDTLWDGHFSIIGGRTVRGELDIPCPGYEKWLENSSSDLYLGLKHYDPSSWDTDGDKKSDREEHDRMQSKNPVYTEYVDACTRESKLVDAPNEPTELAFMDINYEKIRSRTSDNGWDNIATFDLKDDQYILFFSSESGKISIDKQISPKEHKRMWNYAWSVLAKGYDNVVPFEINGEPHILFLKSSDGNIRAYKMTVDGAQYAWKGDLSGGFDSAASFFGSTGQQYILFNKSGSNWTEIFEVEKGGLKSLYAEKTWGKGYDVVVPFYEDDVPYMLFINDYNSRVRVEQIGSNALYPKWNNESKWSGGYDSVVPFYKGDNTYMLFIKSYNGLVRVDQITASEKLKSIPVWESNWPGKFDTAASFEMDGEYYLFKIKSESGYEELKMINKVCLVPNAKEKCTIR